MWGETGQARDGARAQGVSRQRLTQLVCGQVGSDVTLEEEVSAGGPRASPSLRLTNKCCPWGTAGMCFLPQPLKKETREK